MSLSKSAQTSNSNYSIPSIFSDSSHFLTHVPFPSDSRDSTSSNCIVPDTTAVTRPHPNPLNLQQKFEMLLKDFFYELQSWHGRMVCHSATKVWNGSQYLKANSEEGLMVFTPLIGINAWWVLNQPLLAGNTCRSQDVKGNALFKNEGTIKTTKMYRHNNTLTYCSR